MAIRLTSTLLTQACLAACSGVQTVTEPSLARHDDEWRQRQAELDARRSCNAWSRHANARSSWLARGAERGGSARFATSATLLGDRTATCPGARLTWPLERRERVLQASRLTR
jgi:hypothetical protein